MEFSQTKSIASRIREVILDDARIANTNFKDQLSNVTWQMANRKLGARHTISELTFHIDYYLAGVLQVLEGGTLDIRDKYSFELPPISSQQDWVQLRSKLYRDAERMAVAVGRLEDERLSDIFVEDRYGDFRRNLEAVIEHSYYHLGQLVLIKKMISETSN